MVVIWGWGLRFEGTVIYYSQGWGGLSAKLICFFFPVGRQNKWALSVVQ